MLFNESFWLAFSIILFFTLTFKYLKAVINSSVTRKISDISFKSAESEKLKQEAEDLLNEYKDLHKNAIENTKKLQNELLQEIELIRKNSQIDLINKIKQRESLIQSKIYNLEQKLLLDLRLKSIKLGISSFMELYSKENFAKNNFYNIEKSIKLLQPLE